MSSASSGEAHAAGIGQGKDRRGQPPADGLGAGAVAVIGEDAVVWLSSQRCGETSTDRAAAGDRRSRRDRAETNGNRDWQLMTPEGRATSAKRFFLTNQNYYSAVANDGEFRIDGVPEGTYDLAVRGFPCAGRRTVSIGLLFETSRSRSQAPLDEPLRLGAWQMVDAETSAQVPPGKIHSRTANAAVEDRHPPCGRPQERSALRSRRERCRAASDSLRNPAMGNPGYQSLIIRMLTIQPFVARLAHWATTWDQPRRCILPGRPNHGADFVIRRRTCQFFGARSRFWSIRMLASRKGGTKDYGLGDRYQERDGCRC